MPYAPYVVPYVPYVVPHGIARSARRARRTAGERATDPTSARGIFFGNPGSATGIFFQEQPLIASPSPTAPTARDFPQRRDNK